MSHFSSEELESSLEKIAEDASEKINESNLRDWEIHQIHLVPKNRKQAEVDDLVVCEYVIENGRRVLRCRQG